MSDIEIGGIVYTNKHDLPEEIVRSIMKDRYTDIKEAPFDESTSTLTAPTQQVVLSRRYKGQLIKRDVLHYYHAFLGSIAHQILEDSWNPDSDSIVEERIYVDVDVDGKTVVLSGKLDCFEEPEIRDYKTCKVYKMMKGGFEDWEAGQNIYAYLLRKHGRKVERLNIWAFIGDWKKHERHKINYPKCQVVKVPLTLWSFEQQEEYVKERLARLSQANDCSDVELADKYACSKSEMWQDLSDVAIVKDGAARATKVFASDDRAGAEALLESKYADKPEYKIVERWTKRTRCLDWCDCAEKCQQNRALLKEEGVEDLDAYFQEPIF